MDTNWKACLVDYLKNLRSDATRVSYSAILIRFFSLHPDPCAVTRREIEKFMRTHFPDPHRKQQGELAAATQNQRCAAIAGLYRFASSYVPEGETEPLWDKANPASGIVRGKPERSPKGLTLDELSRLFSLIPVDTLVGMRDRAALLLYFWTGRRRSEIANLRYGDIQEAHFPDGQGGIRHGFKYSFRGKGRKEILDSQELPLPAMEAISWYLIYSGRLETIKPDDPLFIAVGRERGKGGNVRPGEVRPISDFTIAKRIALYAKRAGLHASLHTLRHACAQARYESGEGIVSIMNLLRHQHMHTTWLYLQGLTGAEDKGARLIGDKFQHL